MKIKLVAVIAAAVMMSVAGARAALLSYTFSSINAPIPDGNANGYQNSQTLSGIGVNESYITDVNVRLNISGGYNGDLYVYLTHASGFSVLLNRVGRTADNSFGYSDPGFNVTFDGSAASDVHLYGGNGNNVLTGIWQPDARNVDPATVTDASSRSAFLSSFNGLDPNGTWTLFIADLSSGEQSTLVDWGLDITAVPEPVTSALLVFAGVLGSITLARKALRSRAGKSARS
jgi:subtilisin-like proprotein convertase family protein